MSSSEGSETIRRLWPDPSGELADDEIVASLRSGAPVLRVNFVSSVDGAVTHEGRSGGLSDAADKRHFELLRRVCDVVLVGAGTVRDEGYGPMRVSEESARWRVANGLGEHPVFAIVTGSLNLDPGSEIFTDAPVRPIVVTSTGAPADLLARFEAVADVVVGGSNWIDVPHAVAALHARGLRNILCEGGPTLFGSLLAADAVDELFLTVAPTLEAGDAWRIAAGELAEPRHLALTSVLASGSTLLLRYARA
ncbi:MAG TPA: pyrimidine reductase family protein [Terrimesophilobacter sp.]|nr:pyrimidine reductase family protein [Terrimesophilobacter sp.]